MAPCTAAARRSMPFWACLLLISAAHSSAVAQNDDDARARTGQEAPHVQADEAERLVYRRMLSPLVEDPYNSRIPASVYHEQRKAGEARGRRAIAALASADVSERLQALLLVRGAFRGDQSAPGAAGFYSVVRTEWKDIVDRALQQRHSPDRLLRHFGLACALDVYAAAVSGHHAVEKIRMHVEGQEDAALLSRYRSALSLNLSDDVAREAVEALVVTGLALLRSDIYLDRSRGAFLLSRCGRPGYVGLVARELRRACLAEKRQLVKQDMLLALSWFYADARLTVLSEKSDAFFSTTEALQALHSRHDDEQLLMEACIYAYHIRRWRTSWKSKLAMRFKTTLDAGTVADRRRIQNALRLVPDLQKHQESD